MICLPTRSTSDAYLLHRNIVSDLVRNPQGKIAQHVRRVGEAQVCTSITVATELGYPATQNGSTKPLAQLQAVLRALEVLPLEARQRLGTEDCARGFSRLARQLEAMISLLRLRQVALGYTVVTDNDHEFTRVGDLRCENWRR